MKATIKKTVLVVVCVLVLIPTVFLTYLTVKNPKHEDVESLELLNNPAAIASSEAIFKATTFNIGYGGLDQDQDFFADGGSRSRAESYERVMENLQATKEFLTKDNADFIFIQEIDRKSSRSYNIEQYQYYLNNLSGYGASFAYNYNAIWVPVPIFNPMGYANAGLGTFSKYQMNHALRIQLRGQESWPMILAELDRCFIETKIPLDNGKSMFLINLHLSAYDKGGLLRSKQVEHLIDHMTHLYDSGHYVVLGGDWNQLLTLKSFEDVKGENWPEWLVKAPDSLTESGFYWAIDESVMTVRDLDAPYVKGQTFETVIDGFLLSPNIELHAVYGHDLKFEFSDHNPVTIEFKLID